MKHVLVETNWVVAALAPEPFRSEAAVRLRDQARAGDFVLHVPAVCLREGENKIREKFKPKTKDLSSFRRAAVARQELTPDEDRVIQRFLGSFEGVIRRDLADLSRTLGEFHVETNVRVFPLTDKALERCLALRPIHGLRPFDEAILAAVLDRCSSLTQAAPHDELCFVTLDEDLLPFNKQGRKSDLATLYDQARVWVYGDFLLSSPPRPDNWP